MEDRATEVLVALKNANLSIEAKAAALSKLKSDIKQKNVPPEAISPVFDAVRLAILSPHASLSTTGFSSLAHLLKRLYLQQQHKEVSYQGHQFYTLLLERLGDHKERIRSQASQAFADFWAAAAPDVEQYVLGTALLSKNPRAKQTSMLWLARMTREHGLRFRVHLSKLVACLEDADSGVRETAKSTVIELFQNVPSKALSDLKKQLQVHNVRKSIVSSIMSNLGANGQDVDMSRSEIIRPTSSISTRREELTRPTSVLSMRSYSNGDSSNQSRMDTSLQKQAPSVKTEQQRKEPPTLLHTASNESFPPPTNDMTEQESLEPLYVNSQREFEDIIHSMLPYFEGKESEQNWSLREKSVIKLRRITNGNAPHDYQHLYVSSMKALLDGILKTVNSLRTTLSTAGCNLIQDMARTCGPAIDHMVEILLQQFIKLCAALKKITAQSGNVTVDAIIGNVSYTTRIMQHMWAACQDKNVQPRLFLTGWIKTIINKHGSHKSAIEHGGGLELMEKCIKKGLADPNPGVRENMRGTYWVFARVWPDKAEGIISSLDAKSRTLLEKDPGNPNRNQISQNTGTSRPRLGATTPGRPTLKETIRAQKRANVSSSRSIPTRPESAHSSYTDTRATKPIAHRPHLTTSSTTRTVPTGASLSSSQGGSLSSAPMRPSGRSRRPEIVRPATADPYSRRNVHNNSVQPKAESPVPSPRRLRTKSAVATPALPKSRIGEASRSTVRNKAMRSDESGGLPLREARSVADIDDERANASANNIRAPATPTRANSAAPVSYAASPKNVVMSPTISPMAGRIIASPEHDVSASLADWHLPTSPVQRTVHDSMPNVSVSPTSCSRNASEELQSAMLSSRHSTNDSDVLATKPASPVEQEDLSPTVHVSDAPNPSGGLQVYEDPQSPSDTKEAAISVESTQFASKIPGTPVKSAPLEERALNQPATLTNRKHNQVHETPKLQSPTTPMVPNTDATHRRWKKVEGSERKRSLSPRSKDPVRAGDMIYRGLNKIRAGAIDVHGYRKFQSLLRHHDSIVNDESKYSEILLALLETLASPDGEKPTFRSIDLKTQVLVTIRLLLALNRQHFSRYYARAMTAIIVARKLYDSTNHFVSGLEETSEDIVSACNPPEVIDAVLTLLEKEENTLDGCRMISMGTYILSGLVHRLNDRNMILTATELQHLGSFARQNLRNPQPDVRRAVIEFCLELHDMVKPEEVFWSMVSSPGEDVRPLLTYYIMRKPTRT